MLSKTFALDFLKALDATGAIKHLVVIQVGFISMKTRNENCLFAYELLDMFHGGYAFPVRPIR